jgi:2'-5' RNA ligase
MQGVVSLLDDQHYTQVEHIWGEFQDRFGVHGVHLTPFPHFSYHVAQQYDLKPLEAYLQAFAAQSSNFRVRTSGLGIFTGAQPVLFISVVRSPELSDFQHRLWSEVSRYAADSAEYYDPAYWLPHITLGQGDIDHDMLPKLVRLLSERDFDWEMDVNNLSIIHDTGAQQVVRLRVPFA